MKNVFLFFLLFFSIFSSKVFSSENKSEVKFVGCNNYVQKDNLILDSTNI